MSVLRKLPDGTAWPVPGGELDQLERDLRYLADPGKRALEAASVVAAYRHLLSLSNRERNAKVKMIRDAAQPDTETGGKP